MNKELKYGEIIDSGTHTLIHVEYKENVVACFNADWIPDDTKDWLSERLYDILKSAYNAGKREERERVKESLSVLKELLK